MNQKKLNKLVKLDQKYHWKYYFVVNGDKVSFDWFDQLVLFIIAPVISGIIYPFKKIKNLIDKTIIEGEYKEQ